MWGIDKEWTLFLDRDGVLNERIWGGYVTSPDQLVVLPGVKEGLEVLNQYFGRIVVVTNQQGIAKGLMTVDDLKKVHQALDKQLGEEKLKRFYFAPELKTDPNNTRKPRPVMAFQALGDFPEIDFEKSVMVGDTDSDIQFGKNLGMKTVRIKTEESIGVLADLTVDSLYEFSTKISNS